MQHIVDIVTIMSTLIISYGHVMHNNKLKINLNQERNKLIKYLHTHAKNLHPHIQIIFTWTGIAALNANYHHSQIYIGNRGFITDIEYNKLIILSIAPKSINKFITNIQNEIAIFLVKIILPIFRTEEALNKINQHQTNNQIQNTKSIKTYFNNITTDNMNNPYELTDYLTSQFRSMDNNET